MALTGEQKRRLREKLVLETGHRCIICGEWSENDYMWSCSTICPPARMRNGDPSEKILLCKSCADEKNKFPVPAFMMSKPFGQRLGYWLRVQKAARAKRITPEKKALLLRGFSLFGKRMSLDYQEMVHHLESKLLFESAGMCIYCGSPLTAETMTLDHIRSRASGGRRNFPNVVACCSQCNSQKADLSVTEYIESFSFHRKKAYLNRIKTLREQRRMQKNKAEILLGEAGAHAHAFSVKLFGQEFVFSVSRRRI